jgi:hypothetical protein
VRESKSPERGNESSGMCVFILGWVSGHNDGVNGRPSAAAPRAAGAGCGMQPWWLVSGMSDEWVVQDGHLFIGGEKIEDQNG